MQPNKYKLSRSLFIKKLLRNFLFGIVIITTSLIIGMIGYIYFEKQSIVDAYANAAMILSGMGPLSPLNTPGGKVFAGTYALFSGIIFLVVIAIVFSPVVHRFFHQFHLEDKD